MKQIEVQIMQQGYLLGCPEGQEERLLQAVERVDAAMTNIRDGGKLRARERIAVLAALNLAFDIADREAAAAALAPQEASSSDRQALEPAQQERLEQLIQRLDHALGDQSPAL